VYIKLFFKLIFIIGLVAIQLFFISGLPFWLRFLNPVIIFLIFSLEFGSDFKNIWWFLPIGLIFDIYSFLPFGFFLVFWPLIFIFARLMAKNFFTNRSFYSFLGLTFSVCLVYFLFLNLAIYFFPGAGVSERFFLLSKTFWLNLFFSLSLNLVIVTLIFNLANMATDRLKPVFLFKK